MMSSIVRRTPPLAPPRLTQHSCMFDYTPCHQLYLSSFADVSSTQLTYKQLNTMHRTWHPLQRSYDTFMVASLYYVHHWRQVSLIGNHCLINIHAFTLSLNSVDIRWYTYDIYIYIYIYYTTISRHDHLVSPRTKTRRYVTIVFQMMAVMCGKC